MNNSIFKIRVADWKQDEVTGLITCYCFTIGLEEAEPIICTFQPTAEYNRSLHRIKDEEMQCVFLAAGINVRERRTKTYGEPVDALVAIDTAIQHAKASKLSLTKAVAA